MPYSSVLFDRGILKSVDLFSSKFGFRCEAFLVAFFVFLFDELKSRFALILLTLLFSFLIFKAFSYLIATTARLAGVLSDNFIGLCPNVIAVVLALLEPCK